MSSANQIWKFIYHNRYWFVIIAGVLIVGFFDDNSFLQSARYDIQINDLKKEINHYNTRYGESEKKVKQLLLDKKAISGIARENYFMKADDEDIFVLSDDKSKIEDETNE